MICFLMHASFEVHKYSTSKSKKGVKSNVATVCQYPLINSAATTTHKIQGDLKQQMWSLVDSTQLR